jgi:hypothetical protein
MEPYIIIMLVGWVFAGVGMFIFFYLVPRKK